MSQSILSEAAAHFRGGRFHEVKALLANLVETGQVSSQILLMLAFACRKTGDNERCSAALDRLLLTDPKAVRALVMKGDLARDAEDDGTAISFYRRALAEAETQPNLPSDLQLELRKSREWLKVAEQRQREKLEDGLVARGIDRAMRSARFQQSLALLTGEKNIYLQQPSVYYFPGLPQVQFYEPRDFGWAKEFEENTESIRQELLALLQERHLFTPYLVSDPRRPPSSYHGLVDNHEWSSLYLWSSGSPVPAIASRCPKTMAALEAVPLARMSVRAPVVMFSLLQAGARIPPHHGSTNARLICHLPLIVPKGCGFRVGNEVREWQEGELLIFDDTIEHEAWNESEDDRVVLIFDIWRPELTAEERKSVAGLFEAIDAP